MDGRNAVNPLRELSRKTGLTLRMIKFSHSIFALPFALASLFLSANGWPSLSVLGWVILAMVAARSAAMSFNRLVDQPFDASNPRTAKRELPSGSLSRQFVAMFTLVACGVFVIAAAMLNPLCLWLSPVALAVVLGYSYSKRFTYLCHVWLGIALGLTPLAAWVAERGVVDGSVFLPVTMAVAVVLWVSGFDLLYSCQDALFDRQSGLHSIPARFGSHRARHLAAIFHVGAVLSLASVAPLAGLGWIYGMGVLLVAGLLLVEHILAHPSRNRLDLAFFHVNSVVGLVVLAAIVGDRLWQ